MKIKLIIIILIIIIIIITWIYLKYFLVKYIFNKKRKKINYNLDIDLVYTWVNDNDIDWLEKK